MPEAASVRTESKSQTPRPVPRPGRIPSSICSALVLLAENADWGHHKFLLSNLSEALSILLFISFICPWAALFFPRPPVFVSEISTSLQAFHPCPAALPFKGEASGRKQSASLPASCWTCVPSSVRGRQRWCCLPGQGEDWEDTCKQLKGGTSKEKELNRLAIIVMIVDFKNY